MLSSIKGKVLPCSQKNRNLRPGGNMIFQSALKISTLHSTLSLSLLNVNPILPVSHKIRRSAPRKADSPKGNLRMWKE